MNNTTINKYKNRIISFLLSVMIILSMLFISTNSINVVQADTDRNTAINFDYELISPNTNYDSMGNIVISQSSNYFQLQLKLNYNITTNTPISAGNLTFTLPTSVFKDKTGRAADASALYEDATTKMMSQEDFDNYTGDISELTNLFVYTESNNNYTVTNRIELSNEDPTQTSYSGSLYLNYTCTLPAHSFVDRSHESWIKSAYSCYIA